MRIIALLVATALIAVVRTANNKPKMSSLGDNWSEDAASTKAGPHEDLWQESSEPQMSPPRKEGIDTSTGDVGVLRRVVGTAATNGKIALVEVESATTEQATNACTSQPNHSQETFPTTAIGLPWRYRGSYAQVAAQISQFYTTDAQVASQRAQGYVFNGQWKIRDLEKGDGKGTWIYVQKPAGPCLVTWRFKWTRLGLPKIPPGSSYKVTSETSTGTTKIATLALQKSIEASVKTGGDFLVGKVEATVSMGVTAGIAASIESGDFRTKGTEEEIFCNRSVYAIVNGKKERVSGYYIYRFSSSYKEQPWKDSTTVICQPTGANFPTAVPPNCFPGNLKDPVFGGDCASPADDLRKGSSRNLLGSGRAGRLPKGDYLCKDRAPNLLQLAHPELPQPEPVLVQLKSACAQVPPEFRWIAIGGIKYNVQNYIYTASVGVMFSDTRGAAASLGVTAGASFTAEGGSFFGPTGGVGGSVSLEKSVTLELLKSADTTQTKSINLACNDNDMYSTYDGYKIEGWQVFQWSATAKNQGLSCSQPLTWRTSTLTCQPVVRGVVLEPRCTPKTSIDAHYRFCAGEDEPWQDC